MPQQVAAQPSFGALGRAAARVGGGRGASRTYATTLT